MQGQLYISQLLAWVNSWHFMLPPLASLWNDVAKWMQKFHTDHATLPRSGFPHGMTNQKHYLVVGNGAASVWNFCPNFSDVILWAHQWWHHGSPLFSQATQLSLYAWFVCFPSQATCHPFSTPFTFLPVIFTRKERKKNSLEGIMWFEIQIKNIDHKRSLEVRGTWKSPQGLIYWCWNVLGFTSKHL